MSTKEWLAKASQNKLLLATPATPKPLMCLVRNENKAVFERLAEAYFFALGERKQRATLSTVGGKRNWPYGGHNISGEEEREHTAKDIWRKARSGSRATAAAAAD